MSISPHWQCGTSKFPFVTPLSFLLTRTNLERHGFNAIDNECHHFHPGIEQGWNHQKDGSSPKVEAFCIILALDLKRYKLRSYQLGRFWKWWSSCVGAYCIGALVFRWESEEIFHRYWRVCKKWTKKTMKKQGISQMGEVWELEYVGIIECWSISWPVEFLCWASNAPVFRSKWPHLGFSLGSSSAYAPKKLSNNWSWLAGPSALFSYRNNRWHLRCMTGWKLKFVRAETGSCTSDRRDGAFASTSN